MKNMKKLLLLVLSLMLLCGIFAVAALAEEPAQEATVVYPDGSTDVVAVGQTITPKTFTEDGLYFGEGNTLYKDDATEGWRFHVRGTDTALSDLTVTADMAGKKIIASGVDKVYYTSKEIATDDSSKIIYHLVADVEKYFSTSNTGDRGDGTNTGASHYKDLRSYPTGTEGRNTVKEVIVTLYEDVDVASFTMSWFIDQASRNGGRIANLDLNGHSVVNRSSGDYVEIKSLNMRLYSSKPGAHWYQPNSATAFYVSDDATFYIGNYTSGNATYSDNLTVHCKTLFNTMYGSGAYIVGGHYYQLEGATTYLVRISRRFYAMQNASFYVQDGNAMLGTPDAMSDNLKKATGCKFYSIGTSDMVTGSKGVAISFVDCDFYGINTEVAETTAKLTLDAACTKEETASFKTVTWLDGTTNKYIATTEAEAKAFVESYAKLRGERTPIEEMRGDELYVAINPAEAYTYDADFNATEVDASVFEKVYYVTNEKLSSTASVTKVYHLTDDVADYLSYLNKGDRHDGTNTGAAPESVLALKTTASIGIILYEDVSTSNFRMNMMLNTRQYTVIPVYFDLNGHTVTTTQTSYIDAKSMGIRIYSSKPGAHWYQTKSNAMFRANDDCAFYLGNDTTANAQYADNISFHCQAVFGDNYGSGGSIIGGKYYQTSAAAATWGGFVTLSRRLYAVQNAEFYVLSGQAVFGDIANHDGATVATGAAVIKNCVFYASNPTPLFNATKAATPVLEGCTFVNIVPEKTYGTATVTYKAGCIATYGTIENIGTADAPLVFARIDAQPIEGLTDASGASIAADALYELVGTADALKISAEGMVTEYYKVGAAFVAEGLDFVDVKDGILYTDPYLNLEGISEIGEGKILAAGEVTIPVAFENSELCAFSYRDLVTDALYAVGYETECGSDATAVGLKFYEIFNAPDAGYEIVMYQDMRITKGVPFGPVVEDRKTDAHNRDYFYSLVNGSIIWDLNGTTVTIDKGVTNLVNTKAANCALTTAGAGATYDGNVVFGFEGYSTTYNFTLKSSAEGGKIVNESNAHVFATGEGKRTQIVFEGENLTIDAGAGLVLQSHELSYDCNTISDRHVINGGTYISANANGVIQFSMNVTIENATFISENALAKSVVRLDGWRDGRVNASNVIFIAANEGAPAFALNGGSKKYTLNITDCTLIGAAANVASGNITAVTYSGNNKAATLKDLSVVFDAAPEGMQAACTSVLVNGKYYKTCGYFAADSGFVTVVNSVVDTTELWIVGATHVLSGDISGFVTVEIDGVWYYRENPIWMAKIGDTVVENILDPKNAGATVVLGVGGDLSPLYFSRNVTGVPEYYHGDFDAAQAAFRKLFDNFGSVGSTVILYSDFTLTSDATIVAYLKGTHLMDLNGHTLTVDVPTGNAMKFREGKLFIYSSREGGTIDASKASYFWMTDGSGHIALGEPDASSTAYGKNFTLICKSMNYGRLWSTNGYIYGGTYIQPEGMETTYFLAQGNDNGRMHISNATFILNGTVKAWMQGGCEMNGVIENVNIIAKNQTPLFESLAGYNANITFKNSNFYNVTPTLIDGVTYTYENCNFNKSYSDAQASGYIAYTGAPVTLTIDGKEYTFGAALVEKASLIDWGYGLDSEYWAVGATATHADTVIDTYFLYAFKPFTVAEGENEVVYGLKSIASGIMKMSLTLQSNIGLNLSLSDALGFTALKIGGAPVDMSKLEASKGYYSLTHALAPNLANKSVPVELTIGANVHVLPVNIGSYARQILATAAYSSMHNLTYAMVAYVSAVSEDASFLAGVEAPDGYDAIDIVAKDSTNTPGSLTAIRFNVASTIAIEIDGAAAEGKNVNLVLATGRSEHADIVNGSVIFTGLYINEFAGDMKIYVDGEEYTYSLENYYKHLDAATQVKIAALYNYAQYAQAYVDTLPKP